MSTHSNTAAPSASAIPPDDPGRKLIHARSGDPSLPHIGLVGDTYTTLLTGKDTAGRFCLIDMHVRVATGTPTCAKNSSSPAGEPKQSRVTCGPEFRGQFR